MATYKVHLIGETPLIQHWDNIQWAESLKKWRNDPGNKMKQQAGDDRSPAWTWLGSLYAEQGKVVVPADNLQTAIREGGSKVGTGRKGATFKRLTQCGMVVNESAWPLHVNGKTIDAKKLYDDLIEEEDYEEHKKRVEKLGFMLFEKRARVGQSKHIRVRPRFDQWEADGTITVFDDQVISGDALRLILESAGSMCGLGDWRPSSPKSPGPFGRFRVEVEG